MLMSTTQIATRLENADAPDPLMIEPLPDIDTLNNEVSSSVDVHLGRWFLIPRVARTPCMDTDDLMPGMTPLRGVMTKTFLITHEPPPF